MDAKDVLFMKPGVGEKGYAKAASFTVKVAKLLRPLLEGTVHSLLAEDFFPCKVINVADLGCAHGPQPFDFMSAIIDFVRNMCSESNSPVPEFLFYLNDLPSNDFNMLFKRILSFVEKYKGIPCTVVGAPGSFYRRLFPQNSLHLAHSFYSVHWLSKVPRLTSDDGLPLNKGNIYISKTSPPVVKQAYLAQFQADFTVFLRCRNEEIVDSGRLMVVTNGRRNEDLAESRKVSFLWDWLAEAIASMVSEGHIAEEKLDTLNLPCYGASPEEVCAIVEAEGSFEVEYADIVATDAGGYPREEGPWSRGPKLANHLRSVTESIVSHHLGEEFMDELYGKKLSHVISEDLAKEESEYVSVVIVLRRRPR